MSDSQVIALRANTQMNVGDLSLFLTFWNADLRLDTVSQPGGGREGTHFLATKVKLALQWEDLSLDDVLMQCILVED